FAVCVPFSNNAPLSEPGRERHGVLLRAAATEPVPDATISRIEALLGLAGPDTLRYADRPPGQRRALRLERAGGTADADLRLHAVLLAGDIRAESWLRTLLQEEQPAQAYGRLLLAPGAQAPAGALAVQSRGRP
ncbi:hypothetical protein, partial [Corallococcus exiguus]|uniref:hypothetical protein n=1 Tax=Corallococcus exiguus TaxID=83462 RepID=UPI001C280259